MTSVSRTFPSRLCVQEKSWWQWSGVEFAVQIFMNTSQVSLAAAQLGQPLLKDIQGPSPAFPKQGELHPLTGQNLPTTMGHEVCGKIKEVSAGSAFQEGQAVIIDPRLCCRECISCRAGIDHCCEKLGFLGFSGISGGFSSTMLVEERMVHLLPDNVPLEYAAIIEPLVVVHHAIKAAGVKSWEPLDVLVVGGGPVGIAMTMTLRAHGAKQVIVSEPTAARRKQVSELANVIINPQEDDVGRRCRAVTGGHGAQVVFDCAGTPQGLGAAFDSIRVRGIYVNVAVWEKPVSSTYRHFTLLDSLTYMTINMQNPYLNTYAIFDRTRLAKHAQTCFSWDAFESLLRTNDFLR